MSSDHCNIHILRIPSLTVGYKGIGAADVEGGNSRKFFGVVYSCLFEDFGCDWDGGVDWVADDRF
jgi:hypothetical protein